MSRLVLTFAFCALLTTACAITQDEFDEQQQQIDALQADIDTIRTQNTEIARAIAIIRGEVDASLEEISEARAFLIAWRRAQK